MAWPASNVVPLIGASEEVSIPSHSVHVHQTPGLVRQTDVWEARPRTRSDAAEVNNGQLRADGHAGSFSR